MVQFILVGILAGLAAALMFLAPVSGTALAFPLFALAGLPLAIAGLGWSPLAAGVAAIAGAAAIAGLSHWASAAIFVLVFGAPLAWLTRLAMLSRPVAGAENEHEWYPPGRLLAHAAVAVAAGLVLLGLIIAYDPQRLVEEMTAAMVEWLAGSAMTLQPPSAAEIEPFVRLNVAVMPLMVGFLALAMVILDLWLAALVTRASGRLRRPRERLWLVALPNGIVAGFAAAVPLAFLPGAIGNAAAVFVGALGGAVALVGLAVLHALTAGMTGRIVVLTITYALVVVSGLPLALLAMLGIGESFFHFRARRFGGTPRQ